ncbi:MAG: hypothetical protein ACJ79E_20820 [Anaeromyxobacteraceae bacterium]
MVLHAVAALLLVAPVRVDRCGYGSARWGMEPSEVGKLYPGGFAEQVGGRIVEYRVMESFGNRSAYVMFRFGPSGLTAVLAAFPRRGTTPKLETDEFAAERDNEARRTAAVLRRFLSRKHGEPFVTPGRILRWYRKECGWVSLQRMEHGKGRAAVGVLYTNPGLQPDDVPRIVRP